MATIVQDLRRMRRTRRLGELEWFEVAYRAYLVAIVGGSLVVWVASLVEDVTLTPDEVADVARLGPRLLGLGAAAAVAFGLRSGSDGGPVALEAADVQHLLLAPVPRRHVLTLPVVQRLRSTGFGGAVLGAIAGLLAADRLPGARPEWAAGGAMAGAAVGTAFVAIAVIAHAARLPRATATVVAAVAVAAQGLAAADVVSAGPFDAVGDLALWGLRRHVAELVVLVVVVALAGGAVALADRLRPEPLVRRADLVAQLRFAATMQDLRTVMLLRRQLRGEHARSRPWWRPARPAGATPARAVWSRGWRGLLRYPSSRLIRMAGLAAAAGAGAVATLDRTTPGFVVVGLALHLLGLDAVEPLSQEIDHPDHTDASPRERGWVLVHHLGAPAVAVVPFALLAAAVVAVVHPEWALGAFAVCVPVAWAGVAGAVISVVRDAPDPLQQPTTAAIPPEFAGFASATRLLYPVGISVLGAAPILMPAFEPTAGSVIRAALAALLLAGVVVWWVRRRDEWRARVRTFLAEGQAASRRARTT